MSIENTSEISGILPIEQFSNFLNFIDGKTLITMFKLNRGCNSLIGDKPILKSLIRSAFSKYFNYDLSWYVGEEYSYQLLKVLIIIGEDIKPSFREAFSILEKMIDACRKKHSNIFDDIKIKTDSFIGAIKESIASNNNQEINTPNYLISKLEILKQTILTAISKLITNDDLLPAITFLLSKIYASHHPNLEFKFAAYNYGRLAYYLNMKIFNPYAAHNALTTLFNFQRLIIQFSDIPSIEEYTQVCLDPYSSDVFWLLKSCYIEKYKGREQINKGDEESNRSILFDMFRHQANNFPYKEVASTYLKIVTAYILKKGDISSTPYGNYIHLFKDLERAFFGSWLGTKDVSILLDLMLEKYSLLPNYNLLKETVSVFKAANEDLRVNYNDFFITILKEDAQSQMELLFQKGLLLNNSHNLLDSNNRELLTFFLLPENYSILKSINPNVFLRMDKKTISLLFTEHCKRYLSEFEEFHIINLQKGMRGISIVNNLNCAERLGKLLNKFGVNFLFSSKEQCERLIKICSFTNQTFVSEVVLDFCQFHKTLFNCFPSYLAIISLENLPAETIEEIKNFIERAFLNKNISTKSKSIICTVLGSIIDAILSKNKFLDKTIEYLLIARNPKVGTTNALLKANNDYIFNNLSWDELSDYSYDALLNVIQADASLQPDLIKRLRLPPKMQKAESREVYRLPNPSAKVRELATAIKLKQQIADTLDKQKYKIAKKELNELKEDTNKLKRKLAFIESKFSTKKRSKIMDENENKRTDFFRTKPSKEEIDIENENNENKNNNTR